MLARTTDPTTSHQSATETIPTLLYRRQQFISALTALGRASTANEVAAQYPYEVRESIRKRAGECVRLGHCYLSNSRVCGVTGKMASTYVVKGAEYE